jgi:DNA-binding beta-propeller fold protein YncE
VLYECLAGDRPFGRDTEIATLYAHLEDPPPKPSVKNLAVPTALDGVVMTAMAKRPSDRYTSAGELSQAMRTSAGALRTAAGGRRTALIVGIAGVVAAVALLMGFLLSRVGGQDRATNRPIGPPLNSVAEIDPETGSVLQIADVTLQTSFSSRIRMAFGEGGVWISNLGTIFHVDPETGATNGIPVTNGAISSGLAVNFRTVWIGGFGRIDPATDKLLPPIRYPSSGCCGATGFRAVWATGEHGILVRIDPRTLRVTNEIPVGSEADDVAVGSGAVWVIDKLSGTVSRIDPKRHRVKDVLQLSGDLERMVAGAGQIWVLDPLAGIVTPIDPQGDVVGSPIQVGPKPVDIAVGLGAVWVADQSDHSIYRIDPVTHLAERIQVGAPLASVVVDEAHRSLWVAVAGNPVPD